MKHAPLWLALAVFIAAFWMLRQAPLAVVFAAAVPAMAYAAIVVALLRPEEPPALLVSLFLWGAAVAAPAAERANALIEATTLGPAIWSFERALALDPGDEDARYNLDKARKLSARRAHDRIEGDDKDPAWMRLVAGVAPSTTTWLFVALYVGFFAALIGRRWARGEWRPPLTAGAAVLAAGALLAGVLLAGRVHLDRIPFGVLLPDEIAVKEGADTNYRTSFDAHAGLRVRIVDQDQDWLRVRLANGLEGWVRTQDVGRI